MKLKKVKTTKNILQSILFVLVLILIDQISKYLAAIYLKGNASFPIIKNIFELQYLENQSAAFSIDPVSILHRIFHFQYFDQHPDAFLMVKMIFFIVLTIIILALMAVLYLRIPQNKRFLPLNLVVAGFFAGAIGNMIDRILHQYVIDFFYISCINFPVFNVADIYVTISAIVLFILVLFVYKKEEDMECIFSRKNKVHKE